MTIRRTEAQHALAPGLQALPPEAVLARLLDGQRAAAAAVAPALPALAAAADVAARVLRRRRPARLCRRRQLRADGAGRRAGARRHLRHPAPTAPRCCSPAARRRSNSLTGAVEDDAAQAAGDVAAAGLGAGDA